MSVLIDSSNGIGNFPSGNLSWDEFVLHFYELPEFDRTTSICEIGMYAHSVGKLNYDEMIANLVVSAMEEEKNPDWIMLLEFAISRTEIGWSCVLKPNRFLVSSVMKKIKKNKLKIPPSVAVCLATRLLEHILDKEIDSSKFFQ